MASAARTSRSVEACVISAGNEIRLSTPPEAFGQREQSAAFEKASRVVGRAVDLDCDHRAECAHLPALQLMLWRGGKAWIMHTVYP